MENNNFLETVATQLGQNGSVKNVYGAPITAQGKTIIPVAQIAMGFGGGHGQKNGKPQNDTTDVASAAEGNKGAGAGGGMFATAKGVYEVTDKCTRFIPANATKQLLVIAAVAFLTGRWVGHRKRKKESYMGHKA